MAHADLEKTLLATEDAGLGARMLRACSVLLDHAVGSLKESLSASEERGLVRLRQLLFIWADRHNVDDGTLDATLQKSKYLMAMVISALRALIRALFEGIPRTIILANIYSANSAPQTLYRLIIG